LGVDYAKEFDPLKSYWQSFIVIQEVTSSIFYGIDAALIEALAVSKGRVGAAKNYHNL